MRKPQKISTVGALRSFQVGKHIQVPRVCCTLTPRGQKLTDPALRISSPACPCVSSAIPAHDLVTVFPSAPGAVLADREIQGGGGRSSL